MTITKAKRNEIVAVQQECSMTSAKGKTTTYDRYFLAKATKVARNGFVTEFVKIGTTTPIKIKESEWFKNTYRVMVIANPEKQALAQSLAVLFEQNPNDNYFATSRLLVDAINAQA